MILAANSNNSPISQGRGPDEDPRDDPAVRPGDEGGHGEKGFKMWFWRQIQMLFYFLSLKVAYCQMQHRLASPAPIQFEALCEKSQLYEPGKAMSLPEQLQFEFRFPNVAP